MFKRRPAETWQLLVGLIAGGLVFFGVIGPEDEGEVTGLLMAAGSAVAAVVTFFVARGREKKALGG